jgi:hypothetical protein
VHGGMNMTLNDLINNHINTTLFILEDLKATDNQKNLFKNLARNLQRQILKDLEQSIVFKEDWSEIEDNINSFISDSRSKNNEQR